MNANTLQSRDSRVLTTHSSQTGFPVGDNYIAAFDPDMNLVWATYHGSHTYDFPGGIAISESNQRLVMAATGNAADNFEGYIFGTFDPTPYVPAIGNTYYQNMPFNSIDNNRTPTGTIFDISSLNMPLSNLDAAFDQIKIEVWPNPTKDHISFNSERIIERVQISDVAGKLIYDVQFQRPFGILNLTMLSKGVYFFTATFEDERVTTKIVKL